jgi:hypothetical protein
MAKATTRIRVRTAFLSPTKGTNNTVVTVTEKRFCQETLTKRIV